MSPAEHYQRADMLLREYALQAKQAQEQLPNLSDADIPNLMAALGQLPQLAHAHAVMATVPEGVYQMAKELP